MTPPDPRPVDRARLAPLLREIDMLSGRLLESAERASLADERMDAAEVLGLATRLRVEWRLVAGHLWPELDGPHRHERR